MRPLSLLTLLGVLLSSSASALANNVQPSILGRGYTPYLNKVQGSPTTPPSLPIKDGASNTTSFGLLATNSDFERVMETDMSVSASGAGWGGSVKASLTKEYRENRKHITFAATQQVTRGTVTLPDPIRLTDTASRLLSRDPGKYIRSYGASIVDSVDLGGSAVFLFTFSFASEEEAMRFSLSADGDYGPVKADLKVSIRELLKRSSNNVTVSGFVTGTTELPKFFGREDGARSEFYSAKYSEEMLQNILSYIDRFDEVIARSTTDQLSQVSFTSRHVAMIDGITLSRPAISILKDTESYANALNDLLDKADQRRSELRLMSTIYKQFNTDDNLKAALLTDRLLLTSEKSLRDYRTALATFGTIDRQALANVRIPPLPPTFCTSPPTELSPRRTQINTGNPQNRLSSPPRRWKEFVLTPKFFNTTYTLWGDVVHGHSRSDPGCNHGHMELRARRRGPNPDVTTPELTSWVNRANPQPSSEEDVIDSIGDFRVCRGQPNKKFSTKSFAFVAADSRDARILYSNWDDTLYSFIIPRVFRCGQPEENTGLRSDLTR